MYNIYLKTHLGFRRSKFGLMRRISYFIHFGHTSNTRNSTTSTYVCNRDSPSLNIEKPFPLPSLLFAQVAEFI